MARLPKVRKGWALAGLALVALVIAGAVQAGVAPGTGRGGTNESAPNSVAPTVGMATGAVSSADSGAKAQIAPAPVPPDGGSTAVVPGAPRVVRTADVRVK